jgi:hypothetical protein
VGVTSVAAKIVRRVIIAFSLAVAAVAPTPTATCDVCRLQLTSRTGPYLIRLVKEVTSSAVDAPRMRVTLVNTTRHLLVVGNSPPSPYVRLNLVTPRARGTEAVHAVPVGRSERILPGSTLSFAVTYPYRLGRPGKYRFNVTYGGVDSNILTYLVR